MDRDKKFCSICGTHFNHQMIENRLYKVCRKCGTEEEEAKGALLVETYVQERTSEAYKVLVNEFTRQDPTLPHVNTIKCPNGACESNQGKTDRDVIYQKADNTNMKYVYTCDVCGQEWHSR